MICYKETGKLDTQTAEDKNKDVLRGFKKLKQMGLWN